ncbi:MAG: hypothetical protein KJP12_04055, partial [Acidimicrobiia bacterium]|nr:hypothetical protein [Acidimicrobiia bacterium]
MRRSIATVLLLVGAQVLFVPAVARAADLDQPTCEAFTGAWWDEPTSTCFVPGDSLTGPHLTVPAGVTLRVRDEPPQVATLDALTIDVDGVLRIETALTLMQPITNRGTVDVASYGHLTFLDTGVANHGVIGGDVGADTVVRGSIFRNYGTISRRVEVWDSTVVHNYGTANLDVLVLDATWINHCGSSYSVAAVIDEDGTVSTLDCSIVTIIDPAPTSGE